MHAHLNSPEAIARRIKRTELIRRFMFANPHKPPPSENTVLKKGWVESPIPDMRSVPKIKSLREAKGLLHMQLFAHHLNQARLKQFRKGEVCSFFFVSSLIILCCSRAFFCEYTNLDDEPAFNFDQAHNDHIFRNRSHELERAASILLQPKKPKKKRLSKGEKEKQKKRKRFDSDGDSAAEEREAEELFRHGEDSDSFDGENDVQVQPRAKSTRKRTKKISQVIVCFYC